MGFTVQARRYRLEWVDGELQGLTVWASPPTFGELLEISKLADLADRAPSVEDMEKLQELFSGFARCLSDWNVENEDGTKVPATLEGLSQLDFQMVMQIILKWIEVVSSVTPPLPGSSNSGVTFPEHSIPTETLSLNQSS